MRELGIRFNKDLELPSISLGDYTTISSGMVSTTETASTSCLKPTPETLTTTSPTVMTALTNVNDEAKLLMIENTFSYVESLSDDELARANQLLSVKGLDFEIAEEQPKIFIKNI